MSTWKSTADKIKTRAELVDIREAARAEGKVVVTANGSFDILHAGHVRILEDAKEQGDILMVGVNTNASVQQYKSPDRPIISEEYRAELIAALACVDYVFLFDEINPIAFVNELKPDIHAVSIEYGEQAPECPAVIANGGKVFLLTRPRVPDLQTSNIIKKIISVYGKS